MALLGLDDADDVLMERGFYSLLFLGRALGSYCFSNELELYLLGDGLMAVGETPRLNPLKAAALGPLRVIPQEYPNMRTRALDISPVLPGRARNLLLRELLAEFDADCSESAVALRGTNRWVEHFEPLPLCEPPELPQRLCRQGTYLITGGLGQIGLALASYLWSTAEARLVLTSRTALPPEREWQEMLECGDARLQRRLQGILDLRAAGAEVLVEVADAASVDDMERVFAQAEVHFGAVDGLIHAPGLVGESSFATIKDATRADCEDQFRAKIYGVKTLEKVLAQRSLDFCVLCSSLSPILGGLGFSAYAASNLYLDAVAERETVHAIPWLGVNWEGWRFAGEPELGGVGSGVAELGLSPAEGCVAFARLMDAQGLSRIVVSTGDLPQRIAEWIGGERVANTQGMTAEGSRPEMLGMPVEPSTPTEMELLELWRQLLGIDSIGTQDSFFELGGNSLLLTQLVALMRRRFKVDLSLAELFNSPMIADIAAQIDSQRLVFEGADREVGEI
jgi:short-subunit dehydrogenase involved in D-alanine esterification of teichoic acids/acyl carrier protein